MFRPTYALVNLDALHSNISEIRKALQPKPPAATAGHARSSHILGLVKADAYGHGLVPIAEACLASGINALGVALVEEAQKLRQHGITCPLLILGPISPEAIPVIIQENLTPTLSSLELVDALAAEAIKKQSTVKIHLKVDTGLSRYGFMPSEVIPAINKVLSYSALEIEGCFTHFAESEKKHSAFTLEQLDSFNRVLASIQAHGLKIPLIHAANSAAVLTLPESHFDMVRPGLILYGIYPDSSLLHTINLKPVLSLKTILSRVQSYPTHTSVGYDRTFLTKRDSLIATIPIGYGDGYSRSLSNRGVALVRGHEARVVGNISMDLTTLDVTDIPGVRVGDEVTLLGNQGERAITADDLAAIIGTIPYEVLCQIGKRVPRIYYNDSQKKDLITP